LIYFDSLNTFEIKNIAMILFASGTKNVKINTEEAELIRDNYRILTGSEEYLGTRETFTAMVNQCLKYYRDLQLDKPEAIQLDEANTKLAECNQKLDYTKEQLQKLNERYAEAQAGLRQSEYQVRTLRAQLEQAVNNEVPLPGTYIVATDPFEQELLEYTCRQESNRLGKQIEPPGLLKQIFLSYWFYGPEDYFPLTLSRKQLRQMAEKHSKPQGDESVAE
jgi:hypothetical protein